MVKFGMPTADFLALCGLCDALMHTVHDAELEQEVIDYVASQGVPKQYVLTILASGVHALTHIQEGMAKCSREDVGKSKHCTIVLDEQPHDDKYDRESVGRAAAAMIRQDIARATD